MVQKTVVVPQLQFFVGRRLSFRAAEADPHGPDNSADHRDPALAVRFWWSMSLLCGSCKFSGAAVEKTFVLPQFQLVEKSPPVVSNHRCSVVQTAENLDKVIDAPVMQGVLVVDIPVIVPRPVPMVFPVRKTIETPLRSTLTGSRCPCCAGRALHACVCATTGQAGPDNSELLGGAAGAVPVKCGRRCVHAVTSSRQSRDEVQIRSSTSSRRTEMGFLPHFEAFFALRPAGREGQGGGDAGSLLPGYGQTHLINTQVRTTTTTTTTRALTVKVGNTSVRTCSFAVVSSG